MSESEEEQDLRRMLSTLEKIDPWVKAISTDDPDAPWEAEPRSPLSADDARTHPYDVSHRAWMAITPAVDFLACLRNSLVEAQDENRLAIRLHSYAQAGLVRGALENAACAVWLLGPPTRMERVTNRLALQWKELKPSDRLRELAQSPSPRTIEERQRKLKDLLIAAHAAAAPAGQAPVIADDAAARKALNGPDYVEIVRRAGELTRVGADVAEVTWRMCSALAHGDASATIGLLDTTVIRQSAPGVNLAQTSPQVKLLTMATVIAAGMTAEAFRLLQERRKAPY